MIQQRRHIQRLPLDPHLECRRRQDVIQQHGQLEAVFFGEEGVDVEHAQLGEGRRLGLQDQLAQVEVFPLAPGIFEDVGQQDVLTERTGSIFCMPTNPSRAITVPEILSRSASLLLSHGMGGAFNEARILTGMPASEPGV